MPRPHGDPHRFTALALFAALSIAWTWPLALRIGSRVAFDPGDPFLNTWILWWNAQAVPFTSAWWSPPIFHPMRGALALSEHLAGVGVFTTPLIHLGASPAFAYNTALLMSCALSGFFTYTLVRRLSGSSAAAACAGLAFALAPFRAGQLSHLQVLTSQWVPLQLLALHAYLDTTRRRWLVVFGIAWMLQGLSNGYYLLFVPVLLVAWIAWFVIAPRRWTALRDIAAAGVLGSLPLAAALLKYREVHDALGLARDRTEMINFSAGLRSFLYPPPMLALWPAGNAPTTEDFLFPGLTIVLLVLVAGVLVGAGRTREAEAELRRTFTFYSVAALLTAALTLGPAVPEDGWVGWLKPYQWLVELPGFSGLRVPSRFAMLTSLCLAIAGGTGLAMILPVDGRRRAIATAIVALGLSLDGWMEPMGMSVPPGRLQLPDVPSAAVVELPPDDTSVSVRAMLRSTSHRRPLINGYSGYIPPHYAILGHSLRRGDASALVELARERPLLIVLPAPHDRPGRFRGLVESIPGIEQADVSGAGMVYILRRQPQLLRPRGGPSHPFTTARLPRSHVVLDLGSARVVRGLEFPLRDRYLDLGERVAIEASMDGEAWQTVWEDWTAGAALAGALEDQVHVPVRIGLRDVTARYLRIHPAESWLIDELRIVGP